MTLQRALLVALAGFLAGAVNAIVGSGSLITFPTLLALGLPPVTANVTNTVGIFPGSISAVVGYRRELRPHLRTALSLAAWSAAGAAAGACLLLLLPQSVFRFVVPVLVALAVGLVLVQPRLSARLALRHGGPPPWAARLLPFLVLLTAVYGGYFGAAQGVILMALLTVLMAGPLQEMNALKNVVAAVVNTVAAAIFVVFASVDWWVVLVLALSSVAGGQAGAVVGRRLDPAVLRAVIVVAGVAAVVKVLHG